MNRLRLKKEVSEQRLRSGSYYIVQKTRIEKYDLGPLHTYIDAEFHGEFIFGRFRTIRIRLDDLNSKKIKSDSFGKIRDLMGMVGIFLLPPKII